jgi:putative ATP-binding cassette transporter
MELPGNHLNSFALSAMTKSDAKSKPRGKKADVKKSSEPETKSEFVEVTAEGGDHVEPPPPEVVEPDPEMSPEEAEQARKDYLLTRFWMRAAIGAEAATGWRGCLRSGFFVLIVANVGFQYGINAGIARSSTPSRSAIPPPFIISPPCSSRRDRQRAAWRGAGVRSHGHPAAGAAWLTNSVISRWLANGRYYQLNPVGGDHQNPEYRIAEDLRSRPTRRWISLPASPRHSCRPRPSSWCSDHRRRADGDARGSPITIPGFLVIAAVLYAAIASE